MRRLVTALLFVILALQISYVGKASCSEDNLAEVFRVLKENGLSDVAACAIVGNAAAESGGSPHCVESGARGRGIGVFQQSMNANRQALEDYCARPEHMSCPKVVLSPAKADKSYIVCDVVECQVLAALNEFASTMNGRSWSKNYNDQVIELEALAQAVTDGVLPESLDIVNSWEGFKQQDDLFAATVQFQCDYETPGSTNCMWVGIRGFSDSLEAQYNFISSITLRYQEAISAYERFVGPLRIVDDIVEEVDVKESSKSTHVVVEHHVDHQLIVADRKASVNSKVPMVVPEVSVKATMNIIIVCLILLAFLSIVYLACRSGAIGNFYRTGVLSSDYAVTSLSKLATVWVVIGVFGYIIIMAVF